MIAYLSGKIKDKGEDYVILLTGGVGYKVFVNKVIWTELKSGRPADLYVYHHLREDQSALFACRDQAELDLFELLLGVSGIGPKSAHNLLAIATADDVRQAISLGDAAVLTKVSGIGPKTAQRVIMELRDKIGPVAVSPDQAAGRSFGSEEIDALMALGYNMQEAREALREVDPGIRDSGERIKAALRNLVN